MGIDTTRGQAFLKSQVAAGNELPVSGNVFLSVRDSDKKAVVPLAKRLCELGFKIYATRGTSTMLRDNGIRSEALFRICDGRPNVLDMMDEKSVSWVVNTPTAGTVPRTDEVRMRASAVIKNVPITTTIDGLRAAINGLNTLKENRRMEVCSLQEYHRHAPKLNLSAAMLEKKSPKKRVTATKTKRGKSPAGREKSRK